MREFKFFQKETSSNSWTLEQETNITASSFHEQLINQRRLIEDGERAYRFERRNRIESERSSLINPLYVKGSIELKPKWWMRVKMFFQKQYYFNGDFIPFTVFVATTITFFTILVISKILSVW